MHRPYNFCAGPAALPEAVLTRAAGEMLDWHGTGMSFMEMSHRSGEVVSTVEAAESSLRRLLGIGDEFAVLFVQGGATSQFAGVPMNLGGVGKPFAYVNTGQWSAKAMAEASRYGDVVEVAAASKELPCAIPEQESWASADDAAYLHFTPNETIDGIEFHWVPESQAPVVADMSSTLLSRPIAVDDFDVIYAGAQKNIGPAGLVILIVRRELYGRTLSSCPSMMNWEVTDKAGSMLNTPPTYSIYLAGLVFEWLEAQGGLAAMAERNRKKATSLYAAIDESGFYGNPVAVADRSWMNVPFTLADAELDKVFLKEAETAGLLNLKGHRSVGGMRASIYNAIPQAAVDALVEFMQDFERKHA
ncbi:3-phosphoserine/phosphohydroxythreonine transaminase [Congregibacter litoralis]|uniref:Phosphoserine aminotransferase n=1 Tax=Congregibacter litoralis KT71 TaxID=314285 RepID=A4AAR4_9GAMM|nr:3-phosphoserine/phosphohydroxythreonine transaminase [Congregibacter litoralis]EAQ96786.1 phosphoserine aminotransferase apoenzyme [Congregibacter litoralis KT71]